MLHTFICIISFNSQIPWGKCSYYPYSIIIIVESPLDCKEIKPVNPKGNQPWIFIGRTSAGAEALILWPPGGKSWLIGKDPDAGKDGGQEEKEVTEDEMGWIASPTQWTWDWANSRRWWRSGKPGMLRSMGSQRVWYNEWMNNSNSQEGDLRKSSEETDGLHLDKN